VDVSSGVESEPGKKCPLQMKAFIRELGLVGL
jgi:phosphoribosylanthranilate isomerase